MFILSYVLTLIIKILINLIDKLKVLSIEYLLNCYLIVVEYILNCQLFL